MNTGTTWLVVYITLLFVFSATAPSQAKVGLADSQPLWGNEVWSGNAGPYKAIEAEIDKKIAAGMSANVLAETYRKTAEKDGGNPLSQFRWAYSQRKAVLAAKHFDSGQLIPVRDALDKANSPHVYEYTRLHFLIESEIFPGQELLPVGKRILQHNPQDVTVKYNMIRLLAASPAMSDKNLALKLAQEMVASHPAYADYHGNLAGVYMDFWFHTSKLTYAQQALQQYHKYLALAPPDAENRKTVERLLKTLQKMGVQ